MLEGLLDPSHPWKTILGGILLFLLGVAIFGLKHTKSWKWLGWARLPVMGFGAIVWVLGSLNIFLGITYLFKASA